MWQIVETAFALLVLAVIIGNIILHVIKIRLQMVWYIKDFLYFLFVLIMYKLLKPFYKKHAKRRGIPSPDALCKGFDTPSLDDPSDT